MAIQWLAIVLFLALLGRAYAGLLQTHSTSLLSIIRHAPTPNTTWYLSFTALLQRNNLCYEGSRCDAQDMVNIELIHQLTNHVLCLCCLLAIYLSELLIELLARIIVLVNDICWSHYPRSEVPFSR